MSEAFWTGVFAIGVVQGAFLTGALLARSGRNRTAARILALLVAAMTTMILGVLLVRVLPTHLSRLVAFLNINTELAIGPLGYLFVCSVLDPERRFGPRDGLHLAPLALGLTGWGIVWARAGVGPAQPTLTMSELPAVAYFVVFKAAFFLAYVIATYVALSAGLEAHHRFVVGRRSVGLAWLKPWLLGLAAVPPAIYLLVFLERRGLELPVESDQLGILLLTGTIYLASLMLLLRPWILSLTPRQSRSVAPSREIDDLRSYLERERPWLEPELGLSDLARVLGRSQKQLSTLINEGLGLSFYSLMTRYRLAEFEQLARDPAHQSRSVLDLAFDAGFNSKASFYRAFRESHGTTPASYRKALLGG